MKLSTSSLFTPTALLVLTTCRSTFAFGETSRNLLRGARRDTEQDSGATSSLRNLDSSTMVYNLMEVPNLQTASSCGYQTVEAEAARVVSGVLEGIQGLVPTEGWYKIMRDNANADLVKNASDMYKLKNVIGPDALKGAIDVQLLVDLVGGSGAFIHDVFERIAIEASRLTSYSEEDIDFMVKEAPEDLLKILDLNLVIDEIGMQGLKNVLSPVALKNIVLGNFETLGAVIKKGYLPAQSMEIGLVASIILGSITAEACRFKTEESGALLTLDVMALAVPAALFPEESEKIATTLLEDLETIVLQYIGKIDNVNGLVLNILNEAISSTTPIDDADSLVAAIMGPGP